MRWNQVFGGADYDDAYSAQQTTGSGYIVAGMTNSLDIPGYHGDYDVYLDWERAYGGEGDDVAYSVYYISGGGYIVAGWTNSPKIRDYHGNHDAYIISLGLTYSFHT